MRSVSRKNAHLKEEEDGGGLSRLMIMNVIRIKSVISDGKLVLIKSSRTYSVRIGTHPPFFYTFYYNTTVPKKHLPIRQKSIFVKFLQKSAMKFGCFVCREWRNQRVFARVAMEKQKIV